MKRKWKQSDFPTENPGQDYYCADCKSPNDVYRCRKCSRDCWRWCKNCKSFCPPRNHLCFVKERVVSKKTKRYTEFPEKKDGDYYCLSCRSGCKTVLCSCGLDLWKWCDRCGRYRNRRHKTHDVSKKSCGTSLRRDLWNIPTLKNGVTKPKITSNRKKKKNARKTKLLYQCRTCKIGNEHELCSECGKKCWKYCKHCKGYYYLKHPCFLSPDQRKRSRKWQAEDFPPYNVGVFYCADCEMKNERKRCEDCNRACWKWCGNCSKYLSYHHVSKCQKTKVVEEKEEEEEEMELPPQQIPSQIAIPRKSPPSPPRSRLLDLEDEFLLNDDVVDKRIVQKPPKKKKKKKVKKKKRRRSVGRPRKKVTPSSKIVRTLLGMGFSETVCKKASLAVKNSNVNRALNWIFKQQENGTFEQIDQEEEEEEENSSSSSEEEEEIQEKKKKRKKKLVRRRRKKEKVVNQPQPQQEDEEEEGPIRYLPNYYTVENTIYDPLENPLLSNQASNMYSMKTIPSRGFREQQLDVDDDYEEEEEITPLKEESFVRRLAPDTLGKYGTPEPDVGRNNTPETLDNNNNQEAPENELRTKYIPHPSQYKIDEENGEISIPEVDFDPGQNGENLLLFGDDADNNNSNNNMGMFGTKTVTQQQEQQPIIFPGMIAMKTVSKGQITMNHVPGQIALKTIPGHGQIAVKTVPGHGSFAMKTVSGGQYGLKTIPPPQTQQNNDLQQELEPQLIGNLPNLYRDDEEEDEEEKKKKKGLKRKKRKTTHSEESSSSDNSISDEEGRGYEPARKKRKLMNDDDNDDDEEEDYSF